MAGMAAEGREIPIADRELTRGRRGTHSDRAHHHRRWFRAPARCRSETGAPSRPRVLLSWGYAVSTASRRSMPVGDRRSKPSPRFAQLGVRGFDRLPAVDAGRRPALQAVPAFCSVGGTRFRPPPGGRCRSETGAPPSARFCSVGGTRFRPPPGGRCRSETGAPPSACLFALDDARSRCASRSEKSGLLGVSLLRLRLCVTPRQGSALKKLSGISIPLSIPTGRCFTGVGGSGRISTISTFLRHSTTRSPRKAASTIWERCALASPRFTLIIVVLAQRSGTGGPKARSSSTTMTPFSST